MKLKTLVASCALAFAGQAFALPATTVPDVTLFVSGSSALQSMIGQVGKSMFVNGAAGSATATDVFFDGTAAAASGNNYRAYFGVANAATVAAFPSLGVAGVGKKILILETGAGGSIKGVNPVALSQAVNSLDMTTCVAPTTPKVDTATNISVMSCTGVVATRVPDAGVSDVEPALLESGANLPAGTVALTAAQMASLTSTVGIGQVMGIIVGSNATAAMTNLTKAQVAGLMGGSVLDWNMIDPTVAAATKSIVVCRRTNGSGTQAAINAKIFGAPCMTGAMSPSTFTPTAAGVTAPLAAGNVVVVENASSGGVAACMTAAQNGTAANMAISTTSGAMVAAGTVNSVVLPAGNYAIGLMGLDRPAKTGELYQFAAINGVAATLANTEKGAYDIMVESTFNRRTSMPAGPQLDLYNLFVNKAGDPAVLGDPLNTIPGVAALTENGWIAPATFTAATPILRVGDLGNTCQPLQQLQ